MPAWPYLLTHAATCSQQRILRSGVRSKVAQWPLSHLGTPASTTVNLCLPFSAPSILSTPFCPPTSVPQQPPSSYLLLENQLSKGSMKWLRLSFSVTILWDYCPIDKYKTYVSKVRDHLTNSGHRVQSYLSGPTSF